MRTALVESHQIDEVKDIRDKAEALRLYAKQAGEGLENQNMMAEIKLRAERRCGELLGDMEKRDGGDAQRARSQHVTESEIPPTLSDMGISRMQSSRWQAIAAVPEPIFEEHLATVRAEAAELTSAGVLRVAHQIKRQEMYETKHAAPSPVGKYSVIYADPPWPYNNSGFHQSAAAHYPTMTIDDICAMPVGDLADEPCALYMWATVPLLPDALRVLEAWGFEYKTHRVWVKDKAPGMGWWLQTYHELLLIGTRNGNAHPLERLPSIVESPVGRHSRKPDVFRADIERCHAGARIELFARETSVGWEAWGNESI
jgi:N6-adenosine-specific RNA methylase IME4